MQKNKYFFPNNFGIYNTPNLQHLNINEYVFFDDSSDLFGS